MASTRSFVSEYDNVSQVDKWLKNVEYNLEKTEIAVQERVSQHNQQLSSTSSLSSATVHANGNGIVSNGAGVRRGSGSYNARRYSLRNGSMADGGSAMDSLIGQGQAAATGRTMNGKGMVHSQSSRSWSNIENINNYYGGSTSSGASASDSVGGVGLKSQKKAILRSNSTSSSGQLSRSQSLGRGQQLASSLANLKARLGSREAAERECSSALDRMLLLLHQQLLLLLPLLQER